MSNKTVTEYLHNKMTLSSFPLWKQPFNSPPSCFFVAAGNPNPPKVDGALEPKGNSMKVSWVKQDDGGSAILHYLIRYKPVSLKTAPGLNISTMIVSSSCLHEAPVIRMETRDPDAEQQRVRDPQGAGVGHGVQHPCGSGEREGQIPAGNHVLQDFYPARGHTRYPRSARSHHA